MRSFARLSRNDSWLRQTRLVAVASGSAPRERAAMRLYSEISWTSHPLGFVGRKPRRGVPPDSAEHPAGSVAPRSRHHGTLGQPKRPYCWHGAAIFRARRYGVSAERPGGLPPYARLSGVAARRGCFPSMPEKMAGLGLWLAKNGSLAKRRLRCSGRPVIRRCLSRFPCPHPRHGDEISLCVSLAPVGRKPARAFRQSPRLALP